MWCVTTFYAISLCRWSNFLSNRKMCMRYESACLCQTVKLFSFAHQTTFRLQQHQTLSEQLAFSVSRASFKRNKFKKWKYVVLSRKLENSVAKSINIFLPKLFTFYSKKIILWTIRSYGEFMTVKWWKIIECLEFLAGILCSCRKEPFMAKHWNGNLIKFLCPSLLKNSTWWGVHQFWNFLLRLLAFKFFDNSYDQYKGSRTYDCFNCRLQSRKAWLEVFLAQIFFYQALF